MKRVYRIMLLFLLAAVLFTACSAQAQPDVPNLPSPAVSDGNSSDTPAPDETPGKITLTLAGVGMRTYGWDRLAGLRAAHARADRAAKRGRRQVHHGK